ncbi:MAG: hypothetical protein HHAS10_02870 [Candidatus Altimarinota bacterium]
MKITYRILFFVISSFCAMQFCIAHPLDVSNTTLSIYDDSIIGVTYIHPVELDRILVASGGIEPAEISVDMYYTLTGVLTAYLGESLEVEVGGIKCSIGEYSFRENLMIDEIYSGGFPISYVFRCGKKVLDPRITINFMTEVPLQTNKLYIYQKKGTEMVRTDYKVLNAQKKSHSLTFARDLQSEKVFDTDNDGLTDEDELLYRTDPSRSDTDNDGYADGLEIEKSWNPLSQELSPGQYPYEKTEEPREIPLSSQESFHPQNNNLLQDSGVWGSELFHEVLRKIRIYIDDGESPISIFLLLVSVVILGFFHALGPGHSKGVLVSQIINEDMSYIRSIFYCGVFTFVHLLDIVIVVILSKFLFSYIDSSVYLSYIARLSTVLIFGISFYLLYRSVSKYFVKNRNLGINNSTHQKGSIFLAIITGLTPCAFGWSIFLMLFALKKINLALPILSALGLGIFLCLLSIATVTWYSRSKIYSFSPKISQISPIISSVFLLFIGSGLLLQNF